MFYFFQFKFVVVLVSGLFLFVSCEEQISEGKEPDSSSLVLEDLKTQGYEAFPIDSSNPANWGGEFPAGDDQVVLGHLDDPHFDESNELQRLQDFLTNHGLSMRYGQTHMGIAEVEIRWKELSKARDLISKNETIFPSFMKFQKAFSGKSKK